MSAGKWLARSRIAFADDATSVHDFMEAHRRKTNSSTSGELRLMFRILLDAVLIAVAQRAAKRRERAEAVAWIGGDGDAVFGFVNVCAMLGIDAAALREGLVRYGERRRRGRMTGHIANNWGAQTEARPAVARRYHPRRHHQRRKFHAGAAR